MYNAYVVICPWLFKCDSNVLPEPGYFGFDRSAYGDQRYTTPNKWKWLKELRQQREKDINTEIM